MGAGAFAVRPIFELIEAYVLSADRLHGDDTKIPILAKSKAVPAGFGLMFATIDHSAGEIYRRRCSTPHVIGAASIPRDIFRISPASAGRRL
ncbi:hypothetical protein NK6_1193 [Bradyrhizobium diazoefficiens]|uniref:Transposase n=1 Tax=Bradyrhizobium diazoefficiens TaxID=1355477 RepID=A0A0E4FR95_9BRAD|nr:hypothetical protein NK6_1193 [Bradyrhizobium diazoefficiens]